MSRKQLTSKQRDFLQFLDDHIREFRVWPTYRELSDHFGYRSPNSVTQNLRALERKGYLLREDGEYRLVGPDDSAPGDGFPVKGTVEKGAYEAALAIEQVSLSTLFPGLNSSFAVRVDQPVRGVEVDAGEYLLLDGDSGSVKDGEMAAILLDGQAAVCRILHHDHGIRLQHLDGEEVHLHGDGEQASILGRYAGHINQRGLYRLPGLPSAKEEPSSAPPS